MFRDKTDSLDQRGKEGFPDLLYHQPGRELVPRGPGHDTGGQSLPRDTCHASRRGRPGTFCPRQHGRVLLLREEEQEKLEPFQASWADAQPRDWTKNYSSQIKGKQPRSDGATRSFEIVIQKIAPLCSLDRPQP